MSPWRDASRLASLQRSPAYERARAHRVDSAPDPRAAGLCAGPPLGSRQRERNARKPAHAPPWRTAPAASPIGVCSRQEVGRIGSRLADIGCRGIVCHMRPSFWRRRRSCAACCERRKSRSPGGMGQIRSGRWTGLGHRLSSCPRWTKQGTRCYLRRRFANESDNVHVRRSKEVGTFSGAKDEGPRKHPDPILSQPPTTNHHIFISSRH